MSCGTPPMSFPQLLGITRHSISSHLSVGLPFCLLPSTTAAKTLLAGFWSSSRMTCPAHLRLLILMYVIMSLSLYNVYNSSLYFILHSPLSFAGPKMALKAFLSKTPILASSDFDSTQVSEPYAMATTGGQKNAGGYTVYNTINLYICICTCWLYFSSVRGYETFKNLSITH